MRKIIIPAKDQYSNGNEKLFKLQIYTKPYPFYSRDLNQNLKKNSYHQLKLLAKKIQVENYSKIKKADLLEIVERYIRFE